MKSNKELKRLNRAELLELMLAQSKEIDRLKEELEQTKKALADRNLRIEKSGSLAEASLSLYRIAERTQKAADLYLYNIKKKAEEGQASE